VNARLSVFFIAILLAAQACTRISSTEIGAGLIPPIDGINTFDTFLTVQTRNAGTDTIRVSRADVQVVGRMSNDPLFGTTDATLNLEVKPVFYPYSFEVRKDSLFLDSVVLTLAYDGAYGDTLTPMGFEVREVTAGINNIKADSLYSSTDVIPANNLLGTYTLDPRTFDDSVKVFRDTTKNQIRFRLNNSIGQRLLNVFDSTNAYRSDSAYKANFAGLQIRPTSGNGLVKINLNTTNTRLALYYKFRQRESGRDSTTVRYFNFNSVLCNSANTIIRNRNGSQAATYLAAGQTNSNQDLVFLQGGPGMFATLTIPGLTTFPNAIIHRAELQMEQIIDNPVLDNYFAAPNIFLAGFNDSIPHFAVPKDVLFGQQGVGNYFEFGGIPFKKTTPAGVVNAYNFNLTRYVQGIVSFKETIHRLKLYAPYKQPLATNASGTFYSVVAVGAVNVAGTGRVRLGGGNNATAPMRLRIIYSKLQ
jgi:hypothetical protein